MLLFTFRGNKEKTTKCILQPFFPFWCFVVYLRSKHPSCLSRRLSFILPGTLIFICEYGSSDGLSNLSWINHPFVGKGMYVNGRLPGEGNIPPIKKKNKFWEELITYFPWYDTGHIENEASNNSSVVASVFVTAVTFLPLPSNNRGIFTEPLPSNDREIFTEPLPSNDGIFTESLPSNDWGDLYRAVA
jgi:hypothetical protein